GGFADVYRGTFNGKFVALKCMRLHVFCREAVVWKRLNHPHIVPFIGIDPSNQACIVSEWMEHGDVMSYIESHPRANRVQLITDIARGLEYMHASGVVHGDLKSRNVLVDSLGYARLSDFGLATTVLGTTSLAPTAGPSANWGSFHYMPPELFDPMVQDKRLTWKSDVYAFGMTAWEVSASSTSLNHVNRSDLQIFDGRHPFFHVANMFLVIREVLDGVRPTRPLHAGLDDFIWSNAISSCWVANPSERPRISEVLNRLQWYETARRLIAKLLDEGLAEVDRQGLDEMLSTGWPRHHVPTSSVLNSHRDGQECYFQYR
ncbi:kinase-like protein, partial [Punctularia strigosozonata HHB-11173 SS5]